MKEGGRGTVKEEGEGRGREEEEDMGETTKKGRERREKRGARGREGARTKEGVAPICRAVTCKYTKECPNRSARPPKKQTSPEQNLQAVDAHRPKLTWSRNETKDPDVNDFFRYSRTHKIHHCETTATRLKSGLICVAPSLSPARTPPARSILQHLPRGARHPGNATTRTTTPKRNITKARGAIKKRETNQTTSQVSAKKLQQQNFLSEKSIDFVAIFLD